MPYAHRLLPLVALAATACLGEGSVTVAAPTTVASGPVVLQIVPDSADRALATALGWVAGIPGAAIVLHVPGGDRAAVTDAQGRVTLSGVPAGSYVIEVTRTLADAELALVPAAAGALGFAVMTSVRVESAEAPAPVATPAARKRGLVISEWAFNPGLLPGVGWYTYGGYVELFNNGDTTVYLDGLVVGTAMAPYEETPGLGLTCSVYAGFFIEPAFLWVMRVERFPGRGRDYPVAPGRVIVLASHAIDHRPIVANGLDLSHADFEFIGRAGVDNPNVPNMTEEGTPFIDPEGFYDFQSSDVMFLAQSPDLRLVPQKRGLGYDNPFYAVPRTSVLDVYSFVYKHATSTKPCSPIVDAAFDRASASLFGDMEASAEFQFSAGRKPFVERNGRKYLLATHSSRTDFARGPRTPGTVQ